MNGAPVTDNQTIGCVYSAQGVMICNVPQQTQAHVDAYGQPKTQQNKKSQSAESFVDPAQTMLIADDLNQQFKYPFLPW